jgi:hypothetical protein
MALWQMGLPDCSLSDDFSVDWELAFAEAQRIALLLNGGNVYGFDLKDWDALFFLWQDFKRIRRLAGLDSATPPWDETGKPTFPLLRDQELLDFEGEVFQHAACVGLARLAGGHSFSSAAPERLARHQGALWVMPWDFEGPGGLFDSVKMQPPATARFHRSRPELYSCVRCAKCEATHVVYRVGGEDLARLYGCCMHETPEASGVTTEQTGVGASGSSSRKSRRISRQEANELARPFLRENRNMGVRESARRIGCAEGLISKLPAYRAVRQVRRAGMENGPMSSALRATWRRQSGAMMNPWTD